MMPDDSHIAAGVARTVITPPRGIYLIGYGNRYLGNQGVHDDLTATALVLDDGKERVVIVACDLLAINEVTAQRVRDGLGSGIEVLIACAHNHAGPIVYADQRSSLARQRYVTLLVERIVEAVRQAAADLQSVHLRWVSSQAAIAVNRRQRIPAGEVVIGQNSQGPVDRSLNLLRLEKDSGEVLATVINFATHGTVLGPGNHLVSADWIGAMRAKAEAELGGLVVFLQGATGDMNPRLNTMKENAWQAVSELGNEVAGQVVSACQGQMTLLEGTPLHLERRKIWLPLQARVNSPAPPRAYHKPLSRYLHIPLWLGHWVVDPILDHLYPWKAEITAREGVWSIPLQVNSLRIGQVGLVTLGCEVFTEIGMAAKALWPTPYALFASLTDGCIGYLATSQAHAEGGYEVELAPYFYRFPAPLAPQAAEMAMSAVKEEVRGIYHPL